MVRPGSECCVLGLKSSVQAALFGLACASLGAVVASLCWATLELEVAASPRLIETPTRSKASTSPTVTVRPVTEGHHEHCGDDCAFCRARARKLAEQAAAPFVPIHKRPDYAVQPPDILSIDVTDLAEAPQSDRPPIRGEHLVHQDGSVDLGSWGKPNVRGKTTAEIKTTIEELVGAASTHRSVHVAVHAQNSRVYYIVNDVAADLEDAIKRVPYYGNETVVDAITSEGPLNEMGRRQIWISRPQPGSEPQNAHEIATKSSTDTVLPIKWRWTAPTTVVITNPALQPGDRVFIQRPPSWVTFIENTRMAAKIRQARQASKAEPVETK